MWSKLGLSAFIGLFLLSACVSVPSAPVTNISTLRQATYVVIRDDDSYGSGVLIEKNRLLTASHVVAGTNVKITVNGKPARILGKGQTTEMDLALLEVQADCPCLPVADESPAVDDELVMVGYPLFDMVRTQYVTKGSVMGYRADLKRMVMNVLGYFGNSGGPVVTPTVTGYKVVGIMVGAAGYYNGPVPYLTVAVDLDTIKLFLRYNG
jgi:S1-C subfamily serine protease